MLFSYYDVCLSLATIVHVPAGSDRAVPSGGVPASGARAGPRVGRARRVAGRRPALRRRRLHRYTYADQSTEAKGKELVIVFYPHVL